MKSRDSLISICEESFLFIKCKFFNKCANSFVYFLLSVAPWIRRVQIAVLRFWGWRRCTFASELENIDCPKATACFLGIAFTLFVAIWRFLWWIPNFITAVALIPVFDSRIWKLGFVAIISTELFCIWIYFLYSLRKNFLGDILIACSWFYSAIFDLRQ